MSKTEAGEPTPQTCLQVARQAAELAVAAADEAMNAVCRSRSGNTARLEEVMHAAHREATEAEGHAARAQEWSADPNVPDSALRHCARGAVDHAVGAQAAAGVEVTAAALRTALERKLTPQEHAERESERRREEAEREAAERAATGMDADNRHLAAMNAYFAKDIVPALGWTAGHVRVLEAAETGRLYWRDGQARQAAAHGVWNGGRKVSRERTMDLRAAGYLAAVDAADGASVLAPTPSGQVALELARLHPAGLYESDKAAYEARYARVAKRHKRMDDKKAAARRLPALDSGTVRRYQRPVTLAEQEARAAREAADQWEDEGGYCPGVPTPTPTAGGATARCSCCGLHQVTESGVLTPHKPSRAAADDCPGSGLRPGVETPRPAAEPRAEDAPAADQAPAQPAFVPAAAEPPPSPTVARIDQPFLRRLFAPRAAREQQPEYGLHAVIRRPQRVLTNEERERVRDMAALNFQGALILGIIDPVPNASPMPEEAGAWVREHVWPKFMQVIERKYPHGFHRWSMCERGTCWNCFSGWHDLCVHRQKGGPTVDDNWDWVTNHEGHNVAEFIPRPGGEPCVWWCRCECPKDGPAPARATKPKPTPPAAPAPVPVQAAAPSRVPDPGALQDTLW
ncbi:DUF6248 family natural product biosynthesis protein [Streptomyces agglomeratus]|uniref:DUF6248 family natural product biosynthesis protein n=1 Tax=Streptomyces agglomeratus TaxID=285458 RepID=UPI000A850ED5|nr:DUF6248 family natural product biosynthesis protein [Streptomyces agglomeratus]